MKCEDLDRFLAGDPSGYPAEVEAHLAACARCSSLAAWDADLPSAAVPAAVLDGIQDRMAGDLRPVRPMPPPWVLTAGILLLLLGMTALMSALAGVDGLRNMSGAQVLAMALFGMAAATLLSLSLAGSVQPAGRRLFPPWLAVVALPAGFLVVVSLLFPWRPSANWVEGMPCARAGLLMALPAAAVLWLVMRRGFVLDWKLAGAILGAAAALVGAAVLHASCDEQEATHLLTWHGGVIAISIVAGLVVANAGTSRRR